MKSSVTIRRCTRFLVASLAAILLLAPARTGHSATKTSRLHVKAKHVAAARPAAKRPFLVAAGMVIGIDPESGKPGMPTPAQMARLASLRTGATSPRPAPVYHADGSVSLDVRGWMRDYSIVRLAKNGRLVLDCVQGRDAAARTLQEKSAAPAGSEER